MSIPIADYALLSDCRIGRAREPRTARSTGCASRASTARRCSAGCSTSGRPLVDPPGRRRREAPAATSTTRWCWRRRSRPRPAPRSLVDALAVGRRRARPRARRADAPRVLLRRLACTERRGRDRARVRAATRVRADRARCCDAVDGGRRRARRRRRAGAVLARAAVDDRRLRRPRAASRCAPARRVAFALHHRTTSRAAARALDAGRDRRAARRHRGGVADVVGAAPGLRRSVARPRPPQRPGALGADLLPDRRDLSPRRPRRCPRTSGGARNWDYRYAWVRDASFTLEALWVAACPDEADKFFDYMAGAAAAQLDAGGDLQIMFGIGGEHDLTERELPHLRAGATARRCGSATARGTSASSTSTASCSTPRTGCPTSSTAARRRRPAAFLADLADTAAARWQEQDQGIWEVRGEPRHFLYSKLMCWVALDRAIALADRLDADRPGRPAGRPPRARSPTRSSTRGWSDAGERVHPVVRLRRPRRVEPDDAASSGSSRPTTRGCWPRSTPSRTGSPTSAGSSTATRADDGLEGEEGTFLLCTFWLAQALALAGQVDAGARPCSSGPSRFVNDVGLLAEEVDADTGELLGNFPQAFSHIGLVNAAWAIAEAEEATARARENF